MDENREYQRVPKAIAKVREKSWIERVKDELISILKLKPFQTDHVK